MLLWISNSIGRKNWHGGNDTRDMTPLHEWVLCITRLNGSKVLCDVKYDNGFRNADVANAAQRAREENTRRQNEAEAARRKMEAARQQAESDATERRKQVAVANCKGGPKISGGPWFSSTYSVAVVDETKGGDFFCVTTVEYISAAPNPFGGKAARARFTGYEKRTFESISQVRDFAY